MVTWQWRRKTPCRLPAMVVDDAVFERDLAIHQRHRAMRQEDSIGHTGVVEIKQCPKRQLVTAPFAGVGIVIIQEIRSPPSPP